MINKEFVPYELALELKQLGFPQEQDLKWYVFENLLPFDSEWLKEDDSESSCYAPLFQQAFRWFREKYNLHQFIEYIEVANRYDWWVRHSMQHAKTYEEAEIACLKKLISLVKK